MAIRYAQAREHMIQEQLVKRGLTDPLVLAAGKEPEKGGVLEIVEVTQGVGGSFDTLDRQHRRELASPAKEEDVSVLEPKSQVVHAAERGPLRIGYLFQEPDEADLGPALPSTVPQPLPSDHGDRKEKRENGEP